MVEPGSELASAARRQSRPMAFFSEQQQVGALLLRGRAGGFPVMNLSKRKEQTNRLRLEVGTLWLPRVGNKYQY